MGFALSVVYAAARATSAIDLLESVVLAMYTGCTCNRPLARSSSTSSFSSTSSSVSPGFRPCYYVCSSRAYVASLAAY